MQVLSLDDASITNDILFQIADLEQKLFFDAWSVDAIKSVLSQYGAGVLAVVFGDRVVGYCIYQIVFEMAEILRIATAPECQNQGIGGRIFDELVSLCAKNNAERILLEVRADNHVAIGFYHKCGFCQIDVRRNYYQDNHGKTDALILQKELHR